MYWSDLEMRHPVYTKYLQPFVQRFVGHIVHGTLHELPADARRILTYLRWISVSATGLVTVLPPPSPAAAYREPHPDPATDSVATPVHELPKG